MSLELYFLRSSEQKIVTDMLFYAQQLDEKNSTLELHPELKIYSDFYGLTPKDLGLYAMKDATVCGAIWSRKLNAQHSAEGFINEETPVVNIAVKPEFRAQGIGRQMMEQFLEEAASQYSSLSICISNTKETITFFEKFGFKTYLKNLESIIMLKELEQKEIVRPSDNYNPSRWMD